MGEAFLGLGSNQGDRIAMLREALTSLESVGELTAVSNVFETTPVGYADQPDFLNLCAALKTPETPEALLVHLKDMERRAGRQASFRNAPRPLDIDILLYVDDDGSDIVMDTELLTIPHPRMHERAFVLIPLAEIVSAAALHPLLRKTITELRDEVGFSGVRLCDRGRGDVLSRLCIQ